MNNKSHSITDCQGSLNTLAQNGTSIDYNQPVIISGQGSKLGNDKVLKGRAKRKLISQKMSLSLIDVASKKEDPAKKQSFWNTYYCQNRLVSFDGRLYGKYCKNRFCTLCSSIRKADIINRYYPVIKNWNDPYFVTLTVRACKAKDLKKMLKGVIRALKLINEKYRKRNQRGKGIRLIGIKSLECNFNSDKHTYNPHLHLIVASKEIAVNLMNEWLAKWTTKFTSRLAQQIRPVQNMERDLIEIIKYGSKIFTEPDVNKKSKSSNNGNIHAAALYNIFAAMKGLRIFERFGFDLPKETKGRAGARVVNEYYEWIFVPQYHDWLNDDNELTLTGYVPQAELVNLLEYNIDRELE